MTRSLTPRAWASILAIALGGLALRIAAGQGGLWSDEAWSAVYAAQAGDALGVFVRINHDNNHHLNSLWLQLVGLGAPPLLARAPAIAAGFASIVVAALIGGRRGAAQAILLAALFAVAPIMVTYGSEARGYGLLVLAILLAVLVTGNWLDEPKPRPPALTLALLAAFGMLAHLSMIATIAILAAWTYLTLRGREGPARAMRLSLRMWWPGALACGLFLAMVAGAAAASATGMRIGGYLPFSLADFASSLEQLLAFTLGPALSPVWLGLAGAALAAILLLREAPFGRRRLLYALAIFGLPLLVALLRPGNSQYARYYLIGAVALLLLAADLIAHGLARPGWRRWASAAALAAILAAGLWRDAALIGTRRGDPGGPVREMARLAPRAGAIRVESVRLFAMLRVAALRAHYPLRIVVGCAPADFVLVSRDFAAPVDRVLVRCGRRLDAVASSRVVGISGDAWTLYARQALQRSRAPVSGPPPAR